MVKYAMEYPHSGYLVIKKDVYNDFFSDLGKQT